MLVWYQVRYGMGHKYTAARTQYPVDIEHNGCLPLAT